jgi:hypothetical protein
MEIQTPRDAISALYPNLKTRDSSRRKLKEEKFLSSEWNISMVRVVKNEYFKNLTPAEVEVMFREVGEEWQVNPEVIGFCIAIYRSLLEGDERIEAQGRALVEQVQEIVDQFRQQNADMPNLETTIEQALLKIR